MQLEILYFSYATRDLALLFVLLAILHSSFVNSNLAPLCGISQLALLHVLLEILHSSCAINNISPIVY